MTVHAEPAEAPDPSPMRPHVCASAHCGCDCGCGLSRRDLLRLAALGGAGASGLLRDGDARARAFQGDDQPVKIGYLPITDAAPLLVAHANGLFAQQGLHAEPPRLFRSWAQIVEAFVSAQVNVIHLLSPATLWVRYASRIPAKVLMWNHVNGSGLTVAPDVQSVADLGGRTVAIPFWYSVHNILLQELLRDAGLTPVTRARGNKPGPKEVNLIVMPPAEMLSALAGRGIAGYIVAEPFNAAAEITGVGKVLRFSGDVWRNHACCVTFVHERDVSERPEWTQRLTHALVQAQLWTRSHRAQAAQLLSAAGPGKYTPHKPQALAKVLVAEDFARYEQNGVLRHRDWQQQRIDFQPYPFASYTERMVQAIKNTRIEGTNAFLPSLDPAFVARDLVDERFVRKAIDAVGGPAVFDLPAGYARQESVAVR